MTLRTKPFETSYPKWRNLRHGYTVKILGVTNYQSEAGVYSVVAVEGTRQNPKAKASMSADVLRRDFEPIGRKKKPRSAIDRLIDDD